MPSLAHPEYFDEFEVVKLIGTGSYGFVYRVRRNEEEFALKWLRADAEQFGMLRFQNEVAVLRGLEHPHLPSLIAEGTHDERPYVVMTLARGRSLREVWREQTESRQLGTSLWVLNVMTSVLKALVYLHDRGYYHRDIKDDNIVATKSGVTVTLIDLGFSRRVDAPLDDASFRFVGAARYSPPSKLEHPSLLHPSHDVFAIGVVSYLLLTNAYPWDFTTGEDQGHLKQRMLGRPLVTIQSRNPKVPEAVVAL